MFGVRSRDEIAGILPFARRAGYSAAPAALRRRSGLGIILGAAGARKTLSLDSDG